MAVSITCLGFQAILHSNSTFSSSNSESSFCGIGPSAVQLPEGSASETLSSLRQRLHTSMAAPAESAIHQPITPGILVTTTASTASHSNFSLASQDQMLMPTPRLLSCPQAGSGAVMSAVDIDPSSLSEPCHVLGEAPSNYNAAQQQPALAADGSSSLALLSVSSNMVEDAVTPGHLDELPAACEEEGSMQEAGWHSSGPAILVTNDLFQQLPDGGMAAQQSNCWQANDIFETQASIAGSSSGDKAMSAPSDQYSSLLISSSSWSGHSSCWLAESAYSTQSDTLEQDKEHHGLGDAHQSSQMMPGSAFQHPNSQQQQAFSVLFDTQLSQILTTHEDLIGSTAELPAYNAPEAASAQCNTGGPAQQAQQPVSLCSSQLSDTEPRAERATVYSRSSTPDSSVSDSTLISMHSTISGDACIASAHQVSTTAAVADTTAGSAASAAVDTAAIESSAAAPPCSKHLGAVEREPLTAAVSTAQLEVMGWDMFADTLGTFRLLSDTDSDAESTVNLLPKPCELGPITPEVAEHQLQLNQGRYTEDAPAMLHTAEASACPDACQPQDGARLQLIGSTFSTVPADTSDSVMVDRFSCLEQEYHTMLADRQSLEERYPGMSSDAEEFDGLGTGCLGQCTSCAAGVEQCVTCNPCATCDCYPYAALRPGKRHQKSRFKRVWARLRRTGAAAACLHPKFEHERLDYT